MKNTLLGYSQEKMIIYGLDLGDCAILRLIHDIYLNRTAKEKYIEFDKEKYIWLTYGYIFEQLQVIGSEKTVIRKINSMIEKGFLKKKIIHRKGENRGKYMFLAFGELYKDLEFKYTDCTKTENFSYENSEEHAEFMKSLEGVI